MSDADPPPSGDAHESVGWTGAYPGSRPAPYGPDPYATPARPATPPQRPIIERADLWTALLGTIAVLLVGVLATFIWIWLSPGTLVSRGSDGSVAVLNSYPKGFVQDDVMFLFVSLGAGVLCASVAAIVARHRGLAVAVAMGVGGTASAYLMAWLGRWITGGPMSRWVANTSVGQHHLFIQLQTRPFIVAWPVVALVITFAVALTTPDPPVEPAPATG